MKPGHNWVGSNRGKSFRYGTNGYILVGMLGGIYTVKGAYPRWTIANTAGAVPQWQGDYNIGELYRTYVIDEDGKSSEEFKDKLGRVVFKRSPITDDPDGPYHYAYTQYVYDDLNRLRCVMSPQVSSSVMYTISGNYVNYTWSLSQEELKGLCYQYYYDERNRLIERKLPGKAIEYFVYDKWDRQVLYQDGNMRNLKKWMFTFYDTYNRPTVTGLLNSSVIRGSSIVRYYK